MKGIILAGGHGTRLYPSTIGLSKQLIPVYDKPMIYYPLSMLMLADIREILIISDPNSLPLYNRLFGSGSQWGLSFSYAEQAEPRGLAESFIIGKNFIGNNTVCLILGDNIFYGHGLQGLLQNSAKIEKGSLIFGYEVSDPERYGVIEVNEQGQVLSIEEKPDHPKSNLAVPGIYFYDNQVVDIAHNLTPSPRGELEVTDVNRVYLEKDQLRAEILGRGVAWLDAGTHESLLQASTFIQAIQERQGLMVSSPDEIAYRKGFISRNEFSILVKGFSGNSYGQYLQRILNDNKIDRKKYANPKN